MAHVVTINSKSEEGGHFEITLEKTGKDKGYIRAKSWLADQDHEAEEPDADDSVKLYEIRSDKGSQIVCKGDVMGPDPTITCTLQGAQQPNKPKIIVTIEGTFGGFGDRQTEYVLEKPDFDKVRQFIAAAGFPPMPNP